MSGEPQIPIPAPIDETPACFASTVSVSTNGVDVLMAFFKLSQSAGDGGLAQLPVCSLTMSRGAAKDFSHVLRQVMDALDAEFGEINTPFLKERGEAAR